MEIEIWMNCTGIMRKWELGRKDVAKTWRGKEPKNVIKSRETKRRTGECSISISISLTNWMSWLMWLWGGHVSFRVQYEPIVAFSAHWFQNEGTVSRLKPNKKKQILHLAWMHLSFVVLQLQVAFIYLWDVHYPCLIRLFQRTSPSMANPWFRRTMSFYVEEWKCVGEWIRLLFLFFFYNVETKCPIVIANWDDF